MTKSVTKVQDKDTNKRLSVVRSKDDPTKYGVVILNPDGSKIKGPKGDKGDAATISVGTTTTGEPGTSASVTNSGTSSDAVFNFTIPRGDKGETGTISVGTTTTGNPGTNASVTNSGTSTDAVFNFTIPRGDKGETGDDATVSVGTTTTGQPGTNASVTNSGTSGAAVFNFTIPQGLQGEQGNTGNGIQSVTSSKSGKITTVTVNYTDGSTPYQFQISDGADGEGSGDVLGPNSSTDGHFALFDGTSGKLIKNGGAIVDVLNSSSTTDALSANQGKALNTSISTINGKIPSAATTTNQLADKNYVDTSINSVAAYYITKNAAGDQFATHAELTAATTFYSGGVARTPTRNDYCIVADDEDHDHSTTRYIYNNTWEFQYVVNETALTSDQLAALNSGITSGKVSTYDGYATTIAGKQDALTAGSNISITTSGGTTTIAATDTTYSDATQSTAGLMSASDKTKLDGIASGAQVNSITGVKGDAESTYRTGNVNITPANIGITNKAAASGGTADTLVTTGDKYNWNNKQNALTTQTPYTSKGTSTKVPTITTNTLGQVTGITETNISFPVTSVNGDTGAITVQPTLVSGTNIKTVNNESILGSGNIAISGGHDYSWNTLTGTSFTLSGTNYRNLISTSSDTTVSVGTGLTPGMEYIIRITNSDSDNDHTMTFNSVAYIIPKSGTVTYKWLALTATTVEFEGPRYVYSMPATPEEGFIYYVLPSPETPPFVPGANTYAYYTFDDQNANQITDSSGNNRNLTGGVMPTYSLVSGNNYAGNFANTSSGVAPSITDSSINMGSHTILIWVKPTNTGAKYVNRIANASEQLGIIYGFNSGEFELYWGGRITIASGVTTNTWYLLAYTKNSNTVTVYSNGISTGTGTVTMSSETNFSLGGEIAATSRFPGQIGECIIENKVWTAEEISTYYNKSKANYGL